MNKKSIWAVVAGVLFIIIITTLVDLVLHAIGVFPPVDQPLNDALALLATFYRIVISIFGAWLTARLAPNQPMSWHCRNVGLAAEFIHLSSSMLVARRVSRWQLLCLWHHPVATW